jgi:hypothetical protein
VSAQLVFIWVFAKEKVYLPSSIENVQITPKVCFGSINPINYAIWSNLHHNASCHFCFSIHKLNFNLIFCRMVVDIIICIKNIL